MTMDPISDPTSQPTHLSNADPTGVPAPERLTMRSPEDALAAVPVVLGFEPSESMVVMTFGGRETFHARVDLPEPGRLDLLDEVVAQVVEPSQEHLVAGVVLVVYTSDPTWAETVEQRTALGFGSAGIDVLAAVRSDGSRWWAPRWRGHERGPRDGVGFDVSAHRFRAQSVLRGQVVHGSREELAAMLEPVPGAVASVRAARRHSRTVAASGVRELVGRGVAAGRLDDADLAVLLRSLRRPSSRDAAWSQLTRSAADVHLRFWTDVVQRSPADLVADPAAVLALVAWLSGHGALAWCGVDLCTRHQPHHSLARLVTDLLSCAVAPSAWQQLHPDRAADG